MGRIIDRRRVMGGGEVQLPYDYEVEYLKTVPNPNKKNYSPEAYLNVELIIDSSHYVTWEGRVLTETLNNHAIARTYNGFLTHYVRFNSNGLGNYGINIGPIEVNKPYDVRMYIDNSKIKIGTTLNDEYVEKTFTGYQGNEVSIRQSYGGYSSTSIIYIYRNKWYQNGVLTIDAIPVVKDGEPCFYDRINNVFSTRASVAWTAGPRV